MSAALVHTVQAERVRAARVIVLDAAHARHTNWFSHPPQPPRLPRTRLGSTNQEALKPMLTNSRA